MNPIFKKGARVHIETADYLAIMKPDHKTEYRKLVKKKCLDAKWKIVKDPPYSHHLMYEVIKE